MKKLITLLMLASCFAICSCDDDSNDDAGKTNTQQTADDDKKNSDDTQKTGDDDKKTGDDTQKTGDDTQKTGDDDKKTGDDDKKNGDDDKKTGDDESVPEYTLGASCDLDKFTEFCDGSKSIYCKDVYMNGFPIITSFDCASKNSKCLVAKSRNYTFCTPDDSYLCTEENSTKTECNNQYNGYISNMIYTCTKASDGKLYYLPTNNQFCSDVCSEKCEQKTCAPEAFDGQCKGNVAIYCDDDNTVTAFDCSVYNTTCEMIDGFAECAL